MSGYFISELPLLPCGLIPVNEDVSAFVVRGL